MSKLLRVFFVFFLLHPDVSPNFLLLCFFFKHEADYPRLIVSDPEVDLCDPVTVCQESATLQISVDPAVDSAAPPADLDEDSRSFGVRFVSCCPL